MTSEIAILNRSAVAIAADSAITIGQSRVWKNSNKLFSLSPKNDIAVMIYGNGDFCGVPWETIIKMFRDERSISYDTVVQCASDFQDYINEFNIPQENLEDLGAYNMIVALTEEIFKDFVGSRSIKTRRSVNSRMREYINDCDVRNIFDSSTSFESYRKLYADIIYNVMADVSKMHVTNEMKNLLVKVCFEYTRRKARSGFETGVVVTGYGSNNTFPCLESFIVDGRYCGRARYWSQRSIDISTYDLAPAVIIPFAQSDMAHLFMEGVEKEHLTFLEQSLAAVLKDRSDAMIKSYVPNDERIVEKRIQQAANNSAIEGLMSEFADFRREKLIKPILHVVNTLPKEEMAAMAEALVEITSLRRKMDSDLETVGGPVDVAIISKGDGLIWIKRKHYFNVDLNMEYAIRRQKRGQGST